MVSAADDIRRQARAMATADERIQKTENDGNEGSSCSETLATIALRASVWRIYARLSARLHEGQAARGKVEMGTCRRFLRPSGLAFFGAAWSCMQNSKD